MLIVERYLFGALHLLLMKIMINYFDQQFDNDLLINPPDWQYVIHDCPHNYVQPGRIPSYQQVPVVTAPVILSSSSHLPITPVVFTPDAIATEN